MPDDLKALGLTELFGTWTRDTTYTSLDVMLWPCATAYTDYKGIERGGHQDCIWEKEKVMDYLGESLNTLMVTNEGTFKQDQYGN